MTPSGQNWESEQYFSNFNEHVYHLQILVTTYKFWFIRVWDLGSLEYPRKCWCCLSIDHVLSKKYFLDDSPFCLFSGSLWYHSLEHQYSDCTSQMDNRELSWNCLEMKNLKLHPRWIFGAETHESFGLGLIDLVQQDMRVILTLRKVWEAMSRIVAWCGFQPWQHIISPSGYFI